MMAAITASLSFGCSKAPENLQYHLADFNRDGIEDRAYFSEGYLYVSFGKENGLFESPSNVVFRKELGEVVLVKNSGFEFKVGDVTDDDFPDLYFEKKNHLGGASRIVIPNKGDGTFSRPEWIEFL